MANGSAAAISRLVAAIVTCEILLRVGAPRGLEDEAHAPARHAAEHPEAPERLAEMPADAPDQGLGVVVGRPRNDRLDRAEEVPGRHLADAPDVAGLQRGKDVVENPHRLAPAGPLRLRAKEVLLRDHLQDRPDVLRHAPVDQHQAVLEAPPGLRADGHAVKQRVARQQPAAADAVLGIARFGRGAADQLHARPQSSRVLPAASGPAEPFAEDGPRRHLPSVRIVERSREPAGLTGGPHAGRDQPREQAGRHRQPRSLGDVVDLAHDLQAASRPHHLHQQVGETASRAFHAGRHQA